MVIHWIHSSFTFSFRAPSHSSKDSLMLSFSLISPFNLSCLSPLLFLILYLHEVLEVLCLFSCYCNRTLGIAAQGRKGLCSSRLEIVVHLWESYSRHNTTCQMYLQSDQRECCPSVCFPFPYNLEFPNHWEVPSIFSRVSVLQAAQFKHPILDLS